MTLLKMIFERFCKISLLFYMAFIFIGCEPKQSSYNFSSNEMEKNAAYGDVVKGAVNFERSLDGYRAKKDKYYFYFTYKIVHPWWDAVAIGLEDAVSQFEEYGVSIYYDYLAPSYVSPKEQESRIVNATASGVYDVIGVDVADVDYMAPVINRAIDKGQKVMTFSSSDCGKENGCRRVAYVGNTHNYNDGIDLAEALCKRLHYIGKIALLVGSKGVPCHEDRALGVKSVIKKYPKMGISFIGYDDDSAENAYNLTMRALQEFPEIKGIVCCNMSNPVGAARYIVQAKQTENVVIVGMDHDQEALRFLDQGVIYALGIQDCYSIGFDTIQVAVKIADGLLPPDSFPEKTEEVTTVIYQKDAAQMLQVLYGEEIE